MTKADAWMPLYVNDYLGATMRLTTEQHGAYLLLIMEGWKSGGRLPDDDDQLAAIAKMAPRDWRKIAPLIRRYFTPANGELTQTRLTKEVEKAQRLSDARRETGAKGGRPKKQTKSEPKPIGFSEHPETGVSGKQTETPTLVAPPSPSPLPLEVPPNPPTGGVERHLLIEAVKAFPAAGKGNLPAAKTGAAWDLAATEVGGERLLAAVKHFTASEFIRGGGKPRRFDRWLDDRAWEQFLAPAGAPTTAFSGPSEIRAMVVRRMDEGYAVSWLDCCGWQDVPERMILAPGEVVAKRLWSDFGGELTDLEISVGRKAA